MTDPPGGVACCCRNHAAGNADAGAASPPGGPVRFIFPYTPGSAVDVVARLIAQDLPIGQPFIVDNRTVARQHRDRAARSAPMAAHSWWDRPATWRSARR